MMCSFGRRGSARFRSGSGPVMIISRPAPARCPQPEAFAPGLPPTACPRYGRTSYAKHTLRRRLRTRKTGCVRPLSGGRRCAGPGNASVNLPERRGAALVRLSENAGGQRKDEGGWHDVAAGARHDVTAGGKEHHGGGCGRTGRSFMAAREGRTPLPAPPGLFQY